MNTITVAAGQGEHETTKKKETIKKYIKHKISAMQSSEWQNASVCMFCMCCALI